MELRRVAEGLCRDVDILEQAADLLELLRDNENSKLREDKIKGLKKWAKSWLGEI
jgi:hypothetical protein